MSAEKIQTENANSKEFLIIHIGTQKFGIPVLQIQDVLGPQSITPIPLAPKGVAGALNLRGRIVTTIDVRETLNLKNKCENSRNMSVVVEHEQELYSLVIDNVGDVLDLDDGLYESNPPTLESKLKEVSSGIYRLEQELLIILDVSKLLESVHN
jgi:purine-binding chemotaxis protein CheW